MATNRELRSALFEKLGVSQQAISQQISKLKLNCPMSTEDGTYVLAHQAGIKIDKYLDHEKVSHVRSLLKHMEPGHSPLGSRATRKKKVAHRRGDINFPNDYRTTDPILPKSKLKEAQEMAAIYPVIYVIENSIREVIRHVMKKQYGGDWWGSELKKGRLKQIKDNVESRKKKESRQKWHQRRGDDELDYVDMCDLTTIASSKENDFFPDILGEKKWFLHFMDELYPSRNVICHMNPLDKTNIRDVKLKLDKWHRMLKPNLATLL